MRQLVHSTAPTCVTRLRRRRAFSLLELLVVFSIIGGLSAVLLIALQGVRRQATALQCTANMRAVAMKFQFFASNTNPEGRGDSESLGSKRFRINDFQDMLYRVDEFWDAGDATAAAVDARSLLPTCPAVASKLRKQRGYPCGRDALQPLDEVSIAFNMRMYRGLLNVAGQTLLAPTHLTELRQNVLDHPFAPLAIDVDAKAAIAQNHDPFYIAPPVYGENDPYANGRFWFPSDRHGGNAIVAFVGGHVLSSASPASEQWDWSFAGHVGR